MSDTTRSDGGATDAGRWVLLATILGSGMSFIDGTVVNVALPVLQRDLRATGADVQWVIEAYALFLSALILVGGALLVPGSLAIISQFFDGERRGKAIGTWSAFATVTSALGPLLGGWLIQTASWRWIFFINVPLALVTLLVLFRHVPESQNEEAQGSLDYPGAVLATLGLGLVVYGFIVSDTRGLGNGTVLSSLAGGVLALVLFLAVEARSRSAMMPLTLFRSRDFSGTNLLTFLLYGALGGALYFLPFNLQQVQGYTPTEAGASFLPFTVIVFTLSRWTGAFAGRYGARIPLVVGPLIVALGFAAFARPGIGGSYWTTFFPAVVLLSLGMAIVIAPLSTTVMGAVDQNRAGIASGVNNAVSRAAGLLTIAVLGLLVAQTFTATLDRRLGELAVSGPVRHALGQESSRLAGARVPAGVAGTRRADVELAIHRSFVDGFRAAMWIGSGLAVASALCAALLLRGKAGAKPGA